MTDSPKAADVPSASTDEVRAWDTALARKPAADGLREALQRALTFYDALDRPHAPGEAKLLDAMAAALAAPAPAGREVTFQHRVHGWMMECFSMEICRDRVERNHRFLEEALELVQANGCTLSEAHQLVDYVYGRDQGEINQEVGGVMVTLAALCIASDIDMHQGGETELARIMRPGVMDKIRAKQAAKPKHSPLPGPTLSPHEGKST